MSRAHDAQEQAAIVAAFEADPFDWVLDWVVDDRSQVQAFVDELRIHDLVPQPLPGGHYEDVYDRITPELIAELRDQGLVSNHAACTIRYVWTGSRCRCGDEHGGTDLPSDEEWPAVIEPPVRRQASFECHRGHVTTLVLSLGMDMLESWYCDVCPGRAVWTSGLRPGTRFRGWQPGRWA